MPYSVSTVFAAELQVFLQDLSTLLHYSIRSFGQCGNKKSKIKKTKKIVLSEVFHVLLPIICASIIICQIF